MDTWDPMDTLDPWTHRTHGHMEPMDTWDPWTHGHMGPIDTVNLCDQGSRPSDTPPPPRTPLASPAPPFEIWKLRSLSGRRGPRGLGAAPPRVLATPAAAGLGRPWYAMDCLGRSEQAGAGRSKSPVTSVLRPEKY